MDVYIGSGVYTENIDLNETHNQKIIGSGINNTTINGEIYFSESIGGTLQNLTINGEVKITDESDRKWLRNARVTDRILVRGSNNVFIYDVTTGSYGSKHGYIELYLNGSNTFIHEYTSHISQWYSIFAHGYYPDFELFGGSLENGGVEMYNGASAEIEEVEFCYNVCDIYIDDPGGLAEIIGPCTFSSSGEGDSFCGYDENVVGWDDWDWEECDSDKRAAKPTFAGQVKSNTVAKAADPAKTEYRETMRIFWSLRKKIREDMQVGRDIHPANYRSEFAEVAGKMKRIITKYDDSPYAISALGRFAGVCLEQGNIDELLEYMQGIVKNPKLKHLKPHAMYANVAALTKQKNYKSALELSDRILSEFSEQKLIIEILYGKGMIYQYDLKDAAKARKIFKQIVDNYPDHPIARSANKELGNNDKKYKPKDSMVEEISDEFSIDNYPNPFNPSTTISYSLPKTSNISLIIYDIMGREVKSFEMTGLSAGNHSQLWDGTNNTGSRVSSGIYIYRFNGVSIEGDGARYEKSAKLMLMK